MGVIVLIAFAVMLLLCVIFNISTLFALGAGFILFFIYTVKKGFSFSEVLKMCLKSVWTVKDIIITFMLIGMMTGLWRAAGTIPSIIFYASALFTPGIFILLTFLLNSAVSFLTGTAFGTAATMGAVCVSVSAAMNINPVLVGGAVLSGAYFGDRCSPVSTSALLVAKLTDTDIYSNIKQMIKTSLIPFALSCIIYLAFGFLFPAGSGESANVSLLFSKEFSIGLIPLIPAAVMLILSILRLNVKISMSASIVSAAVICIFVQHTDFLNILKIMLLGYSSADNALSSMINGGGIISMINVATIVCLSSSYSGMFEKSRILEPVKKLILRAGKKVFSFALVLPVSVAAAVIACNQTLSIILTNQLSGDVEPDKSRFASYLENSAVVVAPLVPWSIACAVPLTSSGAPMLSVIAAFYLYLLPIFTLAFAAVSAKRKNKSAKI